MKQLGDILEQTKGLKRPKNISREFQHFGVYLADSLGDTQHYSLYIKLAKNYDRVLLEEALTYTKAYTSAKNPARVFMWRLKQLRDLKKEIAS